MSAAEIDQNAEVIYASWGGNGRGLALRTAFEAAIERNAPLLYLAILDKDHFGDLDQPYVDLVIDELEWLLDAQMRLVAEQLNAVGHKARFLVRHGTVYNELSEVVSSTEADLVLIPSEVADVKDEVAQATGVEVACV